MFPNQITLKINKRLKSDEQRESLCQLKKDIFNPDKKVIDTLKHHGFKMISSLSELRSTTNICYYNDQANDVNTHVHKYLVKQPKKFFVIGGVKYWVGLELLCKKQYRAETARLLTNYTYVIKSINRQTITLCDEVEDHTFKLPISVLEYFKLPYASTCYCVQGLSFEGPITIFDAYKADYNSSYVDRNFVWTALTRATDLSQITIYAPQKQVDANKGEKIKQYLKMKIAGYKHQDTKAGRNFESQEYVTIDWINDEYERIHGQCCVCTIPLEIVVKEQVTSNLTIDRLDNSIAHTKTNVRLCCKTCNVTRGNRY